MLHFEISRGNYKVEEGIQHAAKQTTYCGAKTIFNDKCGREGGMKQKQKNSPPNKCEFRISSDLLTSTHGPCGAAHKGEAWPARDELCPLFCRCDGVEIDRENDSDLLVLTTASYSPGCHAATDDGPDVTQPERRDLKMGRCDLSPGYQRRLAKKLMQPFVRLIFAFVFSAHNLFGQELCCLDSDRG